MSSTKALLGRGRQGAMFECILQDTSSLDTNTKSDRGALLFPGPGQELSTFQHSDAAANADFVRLFLSLSFSVSTWDAFLWTHEGTDQSTQQTLPYLCPSALTGALFRDTFPAATDTLTKTAKDMSSASGVFLQSQPPPVLKHSLRVWHASVLFFLAYWTQKARPDSGHRLWPPSLELHELRSL